MSASRFSVDSTSAYYYVCRYNVKHESLDLGRFTEPALHILVSLADGPKHGYAMMEDIRTLSGSVIGPGTLYGALKRLVADGLVEEAGERTDSPGDERRRYYRLSTLGRAVARAEARRLASAVRLARDLRLINPDVT